MVTDSGPLEWNDFKLGQKVLIEDILWLQRYLKDRIK